MLKYGIFLFIAVVWVWWEWPTWKEKFLDRKK